MALHKVITCIALGLTLAVVAAFAGAGSALAGTFTVNADPAAGTGCDLFSPNGGLSQFEYGCDNPSYGENVQVGYFGAGLPGGSRIGYQLTAPPGISIYAAQVSLAGANNINDGGGWGGGGYWSGGGNPWHAGATSVTDGPFNSPYWGFQMICGSSSCNQAGGIAVNDVQLVAVENQGPGLTAVGSNNLWYQTGHYVWNAPGDPWPITLQATDPSGVCSMSAQVVGHTVLGPAATPDVAEWHQCPDQTWTPAAGASVNTREYVPGAGTLPLLLDATNAAGVRSDASEKLEVDNEPVQLNLSGPTTASTTAGAQDVTATASAGPSGVAIACSVDGGPEQWQNSDSQQVPVVGAGQHVVSCRAHNSAVDPEGQYAYSATQSWGLDIGQPTVSAIGFSKIVNQLRCGRVRQRVKVPAHVITVRRHHKLVRVRVRAHTKVERVERCHPRIVWRRRKVWVKVRRHGKLVSVRRTKRVRVTLLPRTVTKTTKRVGYGRATTVSGWVGTSDGTAVGGAPVEILAAADNGRGRFTPVATATTAANGSWTTRLGPGPSRLVEAAYGGSPTLLPATSTTVQTVVPARIKINITPRIVPWGSKIRITGRLLGGYVPAKSNLLRLNVGIGRIGQLEGLPRIGRNGQFVIVWKFDAGHGVLHPWFSVGTLAESVFPYAPATSQRLVVTLGERTPVARHHHRPSRHHKRQKRRRR
ncbi:MAG: hypothetical protein WAU75_21120 [Solirubrobacteraceae bacterium]